MKLNYNFSARVLYAGINQEGLQTISLYIESAEQKEKLTRVMQLDSEKFEDIPIKVNEEGVLYFRAKSKFPVDIYDNSELTEKITIDDIGQDSLVDVFVGVGESKYRGKNYQVAYLKAINIVNLVEKIKFNPFQSNDSGATYID